MFMEIIIWSFYLMLTLLILQLAYWVWQTYQKTFRQNLPKNPLTQKNQPDYRPNFKITRPSNDRNINSRKWQTLLKLVHGDVATAKRLIDCEFRKNPDRSLDWCIDKAIWQLKRDRR